MKPSARHFTFCSILWTLFSITIACHTKLAPVAPATTAPQIREPAVAGKFYPADANILKTTVDGLLNKVAVPKIEGAITALILPHAGYTYSGAVAAHGYKALVGETIDTVILIGSSHHEQFPGASIYPEGAFRTPLGTVEIDAALARALMSDDPQLTFRKSTHLNDHSLEVQLPFLQRTLRHFQIVPILIGNQGASPVLVQSIAKNIRGKNVLLIASSDLSHYPSSTDARLADEKLVGAIVTGDVDRVNSTVQNLVSQKFPGASTFACGIDAITVVMAVEKELGATTITLLNAANSGDVSTDKSRVVGYAAIAFFSPRRGNLLNETEQKTLLEIARTSVSTYVKEKKVVTFQSDSAALNAHNGAFVTLTHNGALRGCLGQFSPSPTPLIDVVTRMGIAAATEDSRFKPVTPEELDTIHYEISVLSPLHEIASAQEIILGTHGVKLVQGSHSGVFLPQVATETGWNKDKFMAELCSQKAGLASTCWQDPRTTIYTFTAQIFGQK